MEDKKYFLTHNDCIMTALYFSKDKELHKYMSCGVIHGNGCNKKECYEKYEHIKNKHGKNEVQNDN